MKTETVRELYSATQALLGAMKENPDEDTLRRYVEPVEDALASLDEETGWEAELEAELDRQLG